jgi:hypothetical protein
MSWPAGAIAIGMFGAIALGLVCDAPARPDRRIVVGSDAAFARAERALRNTGGTIVLRPRLYRRLTISARSRRPLRILGTPGARVEDVYLYGTRNVSLGRVRIGPIAGDAVVELWKSRDVVLHDLVLRGRGRNSASILLADARRVTVRGSDFAHCGDRSPAFVNCVTLYGVRSSEESVSRGKRDRVHQANGDHASQPKTADLARNVQETLLAHVVQSSVCLGRGLADAIQHTQAGARGFE